MPVYYHSSSRKSNGFSIDDIIKNDDLPRTSNQLSSYLPPITWLPSPSSIYQFQRESMLQYLRHTSMFCRLFFFLERISLSLQIQEQQRLHFFLIPIVNQNVIVQLLHHLNYLNQKMNLKKIIILLDKNVKNQQNILIYLKLK